MSDANLDVERVVREVLARLERGDAKATAAAARPLRALRIDDRVVSRQALEGRLDAVGAIAVRSDCIVTPAARDYLQERKISVQTVATDCGEVQHTADLLLGAADTDYDTRALEMDLVKRDIRVKRVDGSELISVVDALTVGLLRGGSLAVLCTAQPEAGLCLANRARGVRACGGSDVHAVERGIDTLGANLLVLDPAAHRRSPLASLVQQFVERGPRECPQRFRKRLG